MDHCQQCGTCCRKGGPAIHREDKPLLEKGAILLKYLFTIRKDEPVYDNVRGCILLSPSDIIRVKNQEASSACTFFNPEHNNCNIYADRPLECRLLKCWDTREIEKKYNTGRLCRKELIEDIPSLYELVQYHENRCAYEKIKKLIHQPDQDKNNDDSKTIRKIMSFDNHFRALVIEKSLCKPEIMDFLFGLPLQKTLSRIRKFREYQIKKLDDRV